MPAQRLGADRREAPRYEGLTPITVLTIKGPIPVDMVDVSLTGCRIRNLNRAPLPRNVTLRLPRHGFEIRAECVWSRGTLSGWRFLYNAAQSEQVRALIRSQAVSVIKLADRGRGVLAGGRPLASRRAG